MMSILQSLNPAQQEAVKAVDGPVMIIAGAGSGKTRALTYRVAYLVSLGVRPYQILALTFTNKAANEMRSRIVELVGPQSADVWMGTFHSVFARILRSEAEKIGFTRSFSIYDVDDSLSAIKDIMSSLGLSQQQFSPHAIRSRISLSKNQLLSSAEYGRLASDIFEEKTALVYEHYATRLRKNNALDFDDLLIKPLELFDRHPKTLEKYQLRFKYILVDEYQDTNRAQYVLIKRLAQRHRNICVVGDDAQSIYAFRGADIRNILDFEHDYPDCRIFRLEQNYRSTKLVLSAADHVIKNNRDQIGKNLWTMNADGEAITVLAAEDEKDEGHLIAEKISHESLRLKLDLKDFVVLYRTNAQSRALEDALRRSGIPYVIVGGVEFYRRKEVKDVLAYLRVLVNPKDDESLLRIINFPYRGIGEATVKRLRATAGEKNASIFDVVSKAESLGGFADRAKQNIVAFSSLMKKYRALVEKVSPSELSRALVDDLGILEDLKKDGTPEALVRRENVLELLSAITEFSRERTNPSLAEFLEEVSLLTDVDTWEDTRNAVTLMTLHSAKGLEFPVVFVTGLEEGLFPLYASEIDRVELEEERRLFYVGITRTMKKLFLSFVRCRLRYGDSTYPVRSRFIDEIPSHYLLFESRTGYRHEARAVSESWNRIGRQPADKDTTAELIPSIELDFETQGAEANDGFEGGDHGTRPLRIGSVVEHAMFGRGRILDLSGKGEGAKAVVHFDEFGKKHLMLKYARLKVL
jgi:DNA helicase-2/ATP-dependent DNA helicase PcrA